MTVIESIKEAVGLDSTPASMYTSIGAVKTRTFEARTEGPQQLSALAHWTLLYGVYAN